MNCYARSRPRICPLHLQPSSRDTCNEAAIATTECLNYNSGSDNHWCHDF